jgi:hypothetical protein
MMTFRQLIEAIQQRPGLDKGWEEFHCVTDGDKEYHLGVNIIHLGAGIHKVIATINDSKSPASATVSNKHMENMSPKARISAALKVKGSVEEFMGQKPWKQIVLGGTPHTREMYQRVAKTWADQSSGAISHKPGTRKLDAAVTLTNNRYTTPISKPIDVPIRTNDPMNDIRKDGKYKRSLGSLGQSSEDSMKFHPSGKYGPSGWKKGGSDAEAIGALSGASASSSEK